MKKERKYDIVIIGAGISGLTLAERYASIGRRVLIIEKRSHIGGNCHDFINEHGILIATYGPHYFHTNDDGVWEYVNRFSEWNFYEHRVVAHVDNKIVPIPVNQTTVNTLFNANIHSEEDAKKWFEENRELIKNPQNAENAVINRMGKILYELLFRGYTTKQWGLDPRGLDAEVTNRIPLRYNNDDRYFTDVHQAMPANGYTKFFEKMIDHDMITVIYGVDYEEIKEKIQGYEKLFFTGRIDKYFNEEFGALQYRSLCFEYETLDQEWFQQHSQENYPALDVPFTRVVEYKRATGQQHPKTTISREYPTWDGEPYYPVPSKQNREIYAKYQESANKLEKQNIYFVGRLANYKYFNMDQAFRNALDLFERLESDIN